MNTQEERKVSENLLDIQDNEGNTPLIQAIIDHSEGSTKSNLIKEMVKADADPSIQNKEGLNALMVATKLKNAEILGMLVMKMLNDELDNKLIGKNLMTTENVLKMKTEKDDIISLAIKVKSKECLSILLDIANMKLKKEHVQAARELTNDHSKIYTLLKKRFQEQEGKPLLT